jgi:molybdenum-dependent DNA-binding transcriptional regulator ModE
LSDYQSKPLPELRASLLASIAEITKLRDAELKVRDAQINKLEEQLKAVEEAEGRLFLAFAVNGAPTVVGAGEITSLPTDIIQTRLRIGDQRYRILCAVRSTGSVSSDHVAQQTGYGSRRVKEQLQADARLGVLIETNGLYRLTNEGERLMRRFEDSRRSMGKSLPIVDGGSHDELAPLGNGGCNG